MSLEEWKSRLESIKISKTDMNKLVLNYLCQEGYSNAVKKFEEESGMMATNQEAHAIDERKEIRCLILKDYIKKAISKINELCPEVI